MKQVNAEWFQGRNMRLIVCSVIYQLVWLSAVYSASRPSVLLLGPGVFIVGLVLQSLLWTRLIQRMLVMSAVSLLVGILVDGVLCWAGVLVPVRYFIAAPLPPAWLLALWAGFGVYMASGLELMYRRPRLAFFAGALAGPLAYRAGVPFGALELGHGPWGSLVAVGIVWAVVFPLLLALAARLAKSRQSPVDNALPRVSAVLLVIAMMWPSSDALALQGDAGRFEPVKRVHDVKLVRRGVGRLRRWLIKGCDIALYTQPGTTRQALFAGGPKALEFYYYVSISGEQFARASDETLKAELSSDVYARFKPQIDQMGSYFVSVEPGDRYLLYFVPGQGTALDLNGKRRGLIPGDAFGDIYFRIWLGDKPLDKALYKGMMEKME